MRFYYEDCAYIEEEDLELMVKRVKDGENFENVFDDIISGYDDDVYYSSSLFEEDVKKEILKRLNERGK